MTAACAGLLVSVTTGAGRVESNTGDILVVFVYQYMVLYNVLIKTVQIKNGKRKRSKPGEDEEEHDQGGQIKVHTPLTLV